MIANEETTGIKSQKPPLIDQLTREDLKTYFDNTWNLNELLFSSIVSDDTYYLSPDPLRNPLVFYFGHTAAFYINKLKMAGLLQKGVHKEWDNLFAVGVDPDLPEHLVKTLTWPSMTEVSNYRKTIYNIVHEVIDHVDLSNSRISQEDPVWSILMGMEHDRIHFETSSVLIRQLDVDLVECPESWQYAPSLGHPTQNEWISMKGGSIHIGKPTDSSIYGWDNEFGSLTVDVKPFKATKNLISNSEFLDFVSEGGYQNKALWTNEGWAWLKRRNVTHPKFWISKYDTFMYRTIFDEITMPMDWPVEINAHEASAYCAWLNDGSRLPSEAEFLLMAREGTSEDHDPLFTNDYNLDFVYGSPTPVGYMKNATTLSGFNDLYGNVWDWLKDDFYPLPEFKAHELYKDFSEPYMDNEHSMMAGGSWITTGTGASKYYRLWFRKHFFQHAGFRLAQSI